MMSIPHLFDQLIMAIMEYRRIGALGNIQEGENYEYSRAYGKMAYRGWC
jgi:hypothetical protein